MKSLTDSNVIDLYMLEAAYKNKVKKVLYMSSSMVYPESKERLTEEQGLDGEPFEKYYYGGWSKRYIKDLVQGALLALEKTATFDIYNIASGINYTINEVIKLMCKLDGFDNVQFVYNNSKPTMIPSKMVSIEKARCKLGYQPQYTLEEGIRETIQWYRENL